MEVLDVPQITYLPSKQKKGSGLVIVEGRPLELQIALAGGEDVYERGEMLKKWCEKERAGWKGEPAKRIPQIPKDFHLQQFEVQREYKECIVTGHNLPIGYHRMEAKVISTDLKEISCFLIAGKKGSGRKNATKVLIHAAKKAGASVYVFGTKEQSLKAFAEQQSTIYIEQKKDWCDYLGKIEKEQRKQHEVAKEQDEQRNIGKNFIEKQCYMYGTGMQDLAIDDTNEIQKNSYRILAH